MESETADQTMLGSVDMLEVMPTDNKGDGVDPDQKQETVNEDDNPRPIEVKKACSTESPGTTRSVKEEEKDSLPVKQKRPRTRRRPFRDCRRSCADRNPRICSICCFIVLPMFLLVCIALLGGYFLAKFEGPNEIVTNDMILASKFDLTIINQTSSFIDIVEFPSICFNEYMGQRVIGDTNYTLADLTNSTDDGDSLSYATTVAEEELSPGQLSVAKRNALFTEFLSNFTLIEVQDFMEVCGNSSKDLVDVLKSVYDSFDATLFSESMTFNWIRCWNVTALGPRSLTKLAATERIAAASNQTEFFASQWATDQQSLFDEYIQEYGGLENATIDERVEAAERAAADATGGRMCEPNYEGTAWFWFTVMTTVGYGNQAPVTVEGRAMVGSFGFLSILAFGGLLANAGNIINVIFRDLLRKFHMRCFATSIFGVFFWGACTFLWIWFIGAYTRRWWEDRLQIEVPHGTGLWFGYISSTTVGLGDYFLQPEVIFGSDVLIFSFMFLWGFLAFSAFLGELASLIGKFDAGGHLEENLRKTHFLSNTIEAAESETLRTLKRLLELEETFTDDDAQMTLLTEEEDALAALLDLKIEQRLQLLQQEEELLKKIIGKKELQRLEIESQRRELKGELSIEEGKLSKFLDDHSGDSAKVRQEINELPNFHAAVKP